MKAPNITQAPWTTSRDAVPAGHVQVTIYAESSGRRVATAFEDEANAQAIASLPDCLAALTAVAHADSRCVRDTTMPIWRDALRHARAALLAAGYTEMP